jgi:predicted metal-dependent enzyme (double-stranded beta helix superfamily)
MAYDLQKFSVACRRILAEDPGVAGREKVCALLQEVLKDADFVAAQLRPDTPERKIVYEDADLGFCILAHSYQGAKESTPHDHGPSWAIYGQARGETEMTDWSLVAPASAEKPGKVRFVRKYKLTPGMAHVYNEGDLHSPKRSGPTGLIRIEGTNMDKVKRLKYEAVA